MKYQSSFNHHKREVLVRTTSFSISKCGTSFPSLSAQVHEIDLRLQLPECISKPLKSKITREAILNKGAPTQRSLHTKKALHSNFACLSSNLVIKTQLLAWGLDRCQMYKIQEPTSLAILRQPYKMRKSAKVAQSKMLPSWVQHSSSRAWNLRSRSLS